MANYDNFLHANTALNWLPRSIMCVGPRKSKFWTRRIRFSTWKPPVNMGNSRFSKKFLSFDNLFFAQEIVWKPSVILLLCLSHLWKLLVPLSWPFFSIYNSNDKLEQRHLVFVFNKNHNANPHLQWEKLFPELRDRPSNLGKGPSPKKRSILEAKTSRNLHQIFFTAS